MTTMLLDMDGVLTDFAAGVCRLFAAQPLGPEQAGVALHDHLGCRPGLLWKRIDEAGAAFWEGLEPMPWADELVALGRAAGRCVIATSPSGDPQCVAGKLRWLQRRFGKRFRDFAITPQKDLLAGPKHLLIDDSPQHVAAFIKAGGRAQLFPSWENGGRTADMDPLPAIRQVLANGP